MVTYKNVHYSAPETFSDVSSILMPMWRLVWLNSLRCGISIDCMYVCSTASVCSDMVLSDRALNSAYKSQAHGWKLWLHLACSCETSFAKAKTWLSLASHVIIVTPKLMEIQSPKLQLVTALHLEFKQPALFPSLWTP